jgi:cytochrome P450
MQEFASIDFFTDPSLIDDPAPYYEFLRAQGPVVPLPRENCVAVVGFDECVAVFRDTVTFSSCVAPTGPLPGLPFVPSGDDIGSQIELHRGDMPYAGQIVTLDPPAHSQSRALLMRLFTPSRLRANAQFMEEAAARQIDEFAKTGRCEVVTQYGGPFATQVIANLLGVPEADRDELRRVLSPEVREKINAVPGQIGVTEKAATAFDFLRDKFVAYIDGRRSDPQADILSEIATARFPDGSLPEAMEVVRLTSFLFAAGQDTTARFLASALRVVAERPELQAQLRAERGLIQPFIEEMLRLEGPTKSEGRLARVSTTLGGVPIPAGTTLVLMLSAANRDPSHFADPDEIRLDRPHLNEHLAFGRGAHTCAGAPLARVESRVSLGKFLDRFSDIRIDDDRHGVPQSRSFEYNPTYVLRGLKELHLVVDP